MRVQGNYLKIEEEFDRLIILAEFDNQYSAAYLNTVLPNSSNSRQQVELLPSSRAHFNILKSDENVEEVLILSRSSVYIIRIGLPLAMPPGCSFGGGAGRQSHPHKNWLGCAVVLMGLIKVGLTP